MPKSVKRHWINYQFPRYLMSLGDIANVIFRKNNLTLYVITLILPIRLNVILCLLMYYPWMSMATNTNIKKDLGDTGYFFQYRHSIGTATQFYSFSTKFLKHRTRVY